MDIINTFGNIANFEFGRGILSPLGLTIGGGVLLAIMGFAWQFRKKRPADASDGAGQGVSGRLAEFEAYQKEALVKMEQIASEVESQRKEVESLLNRCREGVATLSTLLTTFENTFNRNGKAVQPEKSLPGIFTELETSLNHEVQAIHKAVQTHVAVETPWTASGEKQEVPAQHDEESVRLDPPNHRSQATRRAVRILLREGNSTEEIAKKLNLPLEEAQLIVEVLTKSWHAA